MLRLERQNCEGPWRSWPRCPNDESAPPNPSSHDVAEMSESGGCRQRRISGRTTHTGSTPYDGAQLVRRRPGSRGRTRRDASRRSRPIRAAEMSECMKRQFRFGHLGHHVVWPSGTQAFHSGRPERVQTGQPRCPNAGPCKTGGSFGHLGHSCPFGCAFVRTSRLPSGPANRTSGREKPRTSRRVKPSSSDIWAREFPYRSDISASRHSECSDILAT